MIIVTKMEWEESRDPKFFHTKHKIIVNFSHTLLSTPLSEYNLFYFLELFIYIFSSLECFYIYKTYNGLK